MRKAITIKCEVCGKVKKIEADKYKKDNLDCWCYCLENPTFMIDIRAIKYADKITNKLKIVSFD